MLDFKKLLQQKKILVSEQKNNADKFQGVVSDVIAEIPGLSSNYISKIYIDKDRLVIISTHKAYASIIFTRRDLILQRIKENSIKVRDITVI